MQPNEVVSILIIDDDSGRHVGLQEALRGRARIRVLDPSDVDVEDVSGVDLVSVDEYLGPSWDAHVSGTVGDALALQNKDGLAVAAAIQSLRRSEDLSFGISLHTAELEKLGAGLPVAFREPLAASHHDLDWVFDFRSAHFGDRMIEIAVAARSVAADTRSLQVDSGRTWLQVPQQNWADVAVEQMQDCRPPAHALADFSRGHSFLRWLAQRVLPYPTFLLDEIHAATLAGVDLPSWRALEQADAVRSYQTQYAGPLAGLLGTRWWRAGIQQLLLDADTSPWDDPSVRARRLSTFVGIEMNALQSPEPVVGYNVAGEVADFDLDAGSAVRILADGWPVYADDPWARLSEVKGNDELLRLLSLSDRRRIERSIDDGR